MSLLGFWLFMAWIGVVVALGITFLVWAWKQVGPLIVGRIGGRNSGDPEPGIGPQKRVLDCSSESVVTRI
jgi:hypothetical protein